MEHRGVNSSVSEVLVLEHCGAHFFDLGGPSHYSGNYPIGFEHCACTAPVRAMPGTRMC
jgi:hypothetical protein